jgi:nucleoside-diphosphate-sugar epimerase
MLHNEQVNNSVLAAISEHRPHYVLAASSSCVYCDDGPDTIHEIGVFEGEPEMANWGYGWAKRFLEQKLQVLTRERAIPVVIVRPFNIFGERSRWVGSYSGAIPMLVKKILDKEDPVIVWGSGKQRRNYLHAEDCARVMVELVARKYCGPPVNIGVEETVSVAELVKSICEISGRSPIIEFDLKRPEGRFIKSADSTKLRAALDDYPIVTIPLEVGLRRMLNWYHTNFSRVN